jgi:hypothetical protein
MKKASIIVLAIAALAGSASAQIAAFGNSNVSTLAGAVTGFGSAGINVVGASLSGNGAGAGASSGLYFLGAAPNNYGLTRNGIILSSGTAQNYGTGPNTSSSFSTDFGVGASPAQEALLDPITGGGFNHFDVTQLDIQFTADAGVNTVGFDVVFGSDEWEEFVGSQFIDGFGLYLNGVNIAFTAGLPININHPGMSLIPETELDGVLGTPGKAVLSFSGAVQPGVNTLTFIVADTSDGVYDTTAYISGLGIPAPSSLALLGLGGLVAGRRRR